MDTNRHESDGLGIALGCISISHYLVSQFGRGQNLEIALLRHFQWISYGLCTRCKGSGHTVNNRRN